jgi:RNA polymerase sigma factor (sigma-70 family)
MTGMGDDDQRIEDLFGELFAIGYRVGHRILADVTAAEDVAAETLARAVVHWPRLDHPARRQAWVAKVAANLAIDVVRRRDRVAPEPPTARADHGDTTAVRLALVSALSSLPSRQRQVVVLRYLADLPEAEVASSLGLSLNTVKKHTARGLAALRRSLGPTWEEADLVADT